MTKVNLTKEQLNEWTRRLRSGDYEQGYGYLCATKDYPDSKKLTYCCLGVLADQLGLLDHIREDRLVFDTWALANDNATNLPDELIDLNTQSELTLMNDNGHRSFSEIADWIDGNLQGSDEKWTMFTSPASS